jgi:hypothetical protein
MSNNSFKAEKELSRRALLQSVALAGAAAVPLILAGARPASAKMSLASVGYQPGPHGSQNCANCKLFLPPAACKSVAGEVAANGWCKIWVKA